MLTAFPLAYSNEEFDKFNNENRIVGAYTEIIIDAPPSVVRSEYVDLEKRESWDPFFKKIEVVQGSFELGTDDGIVTKISNTIDMNMDGNLTKFPINITVLQNDEKILVWGLKFTLFGYLILGVDHAHLFLPADETGKCTSLQEGVRGRNQVIPFRIFHVFPNL